MKVAKRRDVPSRLTIEDRLVRADPSLGQLIVAVRARIGAQRIRPSQASPFEALVRAIVYQSVSGKAATSIFARLRKSIGSRLTPAKIKGLRPQVLVGVGLSGAKVRAIRELARWFESNGDVARKLHQLPDAEIVERLTALPGIGTWTVNVLLIFNLGRLDVMPVADLGIRRGVQLLDSLRSAATAKQVRERSLAWSPYRSIASIYLWQADKLKLGPADIKPRKPRKGRA
jgi:DNA-3-methyladenine glycosylase II